jgi:hypothetical protein
MEFVGSVLDAYDAMMKHINTEHPDEKVCCEFCGKPVTFKNLTHHILIAHPEEQ